MTAASPEPIDLWEYRKAEIPPEAIRSEDAELLWRRYGQRVAVEFPSPRTEGQWTLTAQGWVGFLPVSPTLALRLRPRVPLQNLFRMLEVAYHLKSFELLPGLTDCHSLEEFYERLANVLARRILTRSRKGFYREYVGREDRLAAIRGRIDLGRALRAPWRVHLDCRFEEHTADVEENRILRWTLDRIRRNATCRRPEVRQTVRTAFGRLHGLVTPQSFTALDCRDRSYTRLNDDYRPLHALCRFFLEHTGPSHESGDHQNLPFLVDMASLFELYVAEWLRENLPAPYVVTTQEPFDLGSEGRLRFQMDLVLYDHTGGTPLAVLDTKYKPVQEPSTADVAQVVAYAEALGSMEAVLLYPIRLERPLTFQVGRIRVRTLGFELSGDLNEAGDQLLAQLVAMDAQLGRRGASPGIESALVAS
ncbi:MAG TPA: restriction endonuclease [Thermoanaerobaculia bacterium]|nr:restriction endonuclease [Thermoanaerobaculia bacterium]